MNIHQLNSSPFSPQLVLCDTNGQLWSHFSPTTGDHDDITPWTLDHCLNPLAFAAGGKHFLVLTTDRSVFAFGSNDWGQLGQGDTENRDSLVRVGLPENKKACSITCGRDFSMVVMEDGSLYGFGQNRVGQLGIGETGTEATRPVKVPLEEVESVVCGRDQVFAKTREGKIFVWGDNEDGQLGLGNTENTEVSLPLENPVLSKFSQIFPAGFYSLALDSEGFLWAWGFGKGGRLGLGSPADTTPTPTKIPTLQNIRWAACGMSHSVALTGEGEVYAWGSVAAPKLQLGEGEAKGERDVMLLSLSTPTLVPIPGNKEEGLSVFAGQNFAALVRKDGTIFWWGRRETGGQELEGLWALPKGKDHGKWDKVMRWVFLGREERGSIFFMMPVECVYHFVIVMQNFRRIW
jgi:alpha-tubulin suppressor-like RCC1 family protein